MEAWRLKWSHSQWSQIPITLMMSRGRIRIRIKVENWIRIRIRVKRWIRIRVKVMRIRNPLLEIVSNKKINLFFQSAHRLTLAAWLRVR